MLKAWAIWLLLAVETRLWAWLAWLAAAWPLRGRARCWLIGATMQRHCRCWTRGQLQSMWLRRCYKGGEGKGGLPGSHVTARWHAACCGWLSWIWGAPWRADLDTGRRRLILSCHGSRRRCRRRRCAWGGLRCRT